MDRMLRRHRRKLVLHRSSVPSCREPWPTTRTLRTLRRPPGAQRCGYRVKPALWRLRRIRSSSDPSFSSTADREGLCRGGFLRAAVENAWSEPFGRSLLLIGDIGARKHRFRHRTGNLCQKVLRPPLERHTASVYSVSDNYCRLCGESVADPDHWMRHLSTSEACDLASIGMPVPPFTSAEACDLASVTPASRSHRWFQRR